MRRAASRWTVWTSAALCGLGNARAEAAPASGDVATSPPPAPQSAGRRAGPGRPRILSAAIGYQLTDRWFTQREPTTGESRSYTATLLSAASANVELYPLGRSTSALARLGLVLDFAKSPRFSSLPYPQGGASVQAGMSAGGSAATRLHPLDTSFTRLGVGLRYWFAAGSARAPWEIGIGAGYRSWSFDFDGAISPDYEVPRARYGLLRATGDLALSLGPIGVFASVGYLQIISVGALGDRRPEAVALGAEGALGVRWYFVDWLALEMSACYTLASFYLMPLPGRDDADAHVLDHTLYGFVGPRVTF